MAWSLNILLIAVAIVLVTYLHRAIQKIRKQAFVYPSEAIIDQILPPEVFEQICMHGDYSSNVACSLVSKYWNHHATKDQIQQHVFSNDPLLSGLTEREELRADFAKGRNKFDSQNWKLDYPDNYPLRWRFDDLFFAKKLGKTLIESSVDNARVIYSALYGTEGVNKYLIKLRGTLQYQYADTWTVKDTLSNQIFVLNMTKLPDGDKYPFTLQMQCEVLVDLKNVRGDYRSDITDGVKRLRLLDFRPYIAGFPLSSVLRTVAFVLLLPCFIVDFRTSTAVEAKFYTSSFVTALFGIACSLVSIGGQVQEGTPPHLPIKKKRQIATLLLCGLGLVSFIFYRRALEMANYIAMLAVCSLYYIAAEDLAKSKYAPAKLTTFAGVCLVILMNDWKLTVDAFKNAQILWTFLYNIGMHVQLGVIVTLHNLLVSSFKTGRVTWRDLKWSPTVIEIYCIEMMALVFITLYAPVTMDKIFG